MLDTERHSKIDRQRSFAKHTCTFNRSKCSVESVYADMTPFALINFKSMSNGYNGCCWPLQGDHYRAQPEVRGSISKWAHSLPLHSFRHPFRVNRFTSRKHAKYTRPADRRATMTPESACKKRKRLEQAEISKKRQL